MLKTKKLLKILLLGLMLSSVAGCATTLPKKPARPTLEGVGVTRDGDVVIQRDDATKLFQYIRELERGYEQ